MKLLNRIPFFLRNKYLLAGTGFVIWISFFDHNDLLTQLERRSNLKELQQSKAYYVQQIAENQKLSKDLQYNAAAIEKYAREKYLMKKDNEDLFIIEPEEKK